MAELPFMKFYPGDWDSDPGIQLLSYEEQGMWFKLLRWMHHNYRRGELTDDDGKTMPKLVAKILNVEGEQAWQIIQRLLETRVASMDEATGIVYNRKMLKEAHISRVRSKAGHKGAMAKWRKEREERDGKPMANELDLPMAKPQQTDGPRVLEYQSTRVLEEKIKELLNVEPIQAVKKAAWLASALTDRSRNHVWNKLYDDKIREWVESLGLEVLVRDLCSLAGQGINYPLDYCMKRNVEERRGERWNDLLIRATDARVKAAKEETELPVAPEVDRLLDELLGGVDDESEAEADTEG